MRPLLYLAHRIPYPPNKGDKIRSFHILRHLRERYRVYLGAFIDADEDRAHAQTVSALCEEAFLPVLDPRAARIASLRGLATGSALTLPYYFRNTMQDWVDRVIGQHGIRHAVVFSSAMAQYVSGERFRSLRRVADFVDVDSDKWRQYAATTGWPWRWIYAREGRTLLGFEARIAREFDHSTFVSDAEADYFRSLAGVDGRRIAAFANGVDTGYYDPGREYPDPYPPDRQAIVFTGAMDYWANVDAVTWFAQEVLPGIRAAHGSAWFYIVGSRPDPRVRALAGDGVVVTGRVEDVRPWIAHAAAAVAPLRIARGIQNKVLEAMAMGRTVFASPQAAEGIRAEHGAELIVEGDPSALAAAITRHLASGCHAGAGPRARQRVLHDYTWSGNLGLLDMLLDGDADPAADSRAGT